MPDTPNTDELRKKISEAMVNNLVQFKGLQLKNIDPLSPQDVVDNGELILGGHNQSIDEIINLIHQYGIQLQTERLDFTTHHKNKRVQKLDKDHISITTGAISFGRNKPPYERVVIEYDRVSKAIRFHEPLDGEYGISYKVGTNPATGSYGFRCRPFEGILPTGYYEKISDHTFRLTSLKEPLTEQPSSPKISGGRATK